MIFAIKEVETLPGNALLDTTVKQECSYLNNAKLEHLPKLLEKMLEVIVIRLCRDIGHHLVVPMTLDIRANQGTIAKRDQFSQIRRDAQLELIEKLLEQQRRVTVRHAFSGIIAHLELTNLSHVETVIIVTLQDLANR